MSIELLISLASVTCAIVVGLAGMKRNKEADDKKEATQMTTVICKLENIAIDTTEIKSEMKSLKAEVQELREKTVIAEQSTKSLHKRVDAMELRLNDIRKEV